jgi:hypothetical protein
MPFLQALGIPLLSASVTVEPIVHLTLYSYSAINNLVADLLPCVQRWLFSKRGRSAYLELQQFLDNQRRPFNDFTCTVVDKVPHHHRHHHNFFSPLIIDTVIITSASTSYP